jgi:very-short-patch-repair endonuclease
MKYDHESKTRIENYAKRMRRQTTGAEYTLWTLLRKRGERWIRRQCIVGRCIIDIGIPSRNLLIEIDGDSHLGKEEKDRKRDLFLKNLGFNVLHCSNDEVFESPEIIINKIFTYPQSEINKERFKISIRAARKRSYWVVDD